MRMYTGNLEDIYNTQDTFSANSRCYIDLALNRYLEILRVYPVFRNYETSIKVLTRTARDIHLLLGCSKPGSTALLRREQHVALAAGGHLVIFFICQLAKL